MSRQPSDATLLRQAKSELRDMTRQRDALRAETFELRTRTNRAEQELAEWKQRFDLLLKRTPEEEGRTNG